MASSEGSRMWSKTKDSIVEAFKKISEVADQETREGEEELEQLRLRSAKVNDLQQENDRLRKELEVALRDLNEERKPKERVIPPSDADSSEEYSPESKRIELRNGWEEDAGSGPSGLELFKNIGIRKVASQTIESESANEEFPNKVPPAWNDELLERKYNDLVTKYKENQDQLIVLQKNHISVLEARQSLEDRFRKLKGINNEFIRYSDHLNRNNKKLKAELASCPHDHQDVLSSSPSPEVPPHKVRKSGNWAGQADSDDDMILRTSVTCATSTSLLRLSKSGLELPPSPPMPTISPSKASNESGQPRSQTTLRDEPRANAPDMSNESAPPGEPSRDGRLPNEITPPPGLDEDEQELPKLKDGSRKSPTQQSNHTSSTQGEPYTFQQDVPNANSPIIKSEGESPVVIRTRRIHKSYSRRTNTSNAAVNRGVKVEEIPSSPLGLAAIDYGGSLDLDDHPHMVTPRKRKTPVISDRTPQSRLSILNDRDEVVTSKLFQAPRSSAILVERSPDRPAMNSNALQPKSSNTLFFPQIDHDQPPQKRQRRHASPVALTSLAEDVKNFQKSNREMQGPRNKHSLTLSDLVENPPFRGSVISPRTTPLKTTSASRSHITPGTSPLLSKPSSRAGSLARSGPSASLSAKRLNKIRPHPKIASSGDVYDIPSSSPRSEQPETTSKASKYSKKKSHEQHLDDPSNDYPDNEPLRCRPVEHLRLDDFKINPIYNQGYNYAFKDVVRKKDERRCLPGCEKSCCGPQFRKLAEITISARIDPLPESVQESDKRALMEYLGADFPRFSKMSKEKKRETLVLAIARQLANDHGKHRHAYARRDSPPGFWDVDFPTTQEAAANREAALQAERQQVEERYREAMRPRGAYIFRDE